MRIDCRGNSRAVVPVHCCKVIRGGGTLRKSGRKACYTSIFSHMCTNYMGRGKKETGEHSAQSEFWSCCAHLFANRVALATLSTGMLRLRRRELLCSGGSLGGKLG